MKTSSRQLIRIYAVAFMIALAAVAIGSPRATAQEATAVATDDASGLPDGVTLEILAYGVAPASPGSPVDVTLYRLALEPGAHYSFDGNDPSLSLAYVEGGELTCAFATQVTVQRAADSEGLFTEQTNTVLPGETGTLKQGDSVLLPPGHAGEFRNEGAEKVNLLVAQVL